MAVKLDAIAAAAVDVAFQAAVAEAGPDQVGDHLSVVGEGERLVTHYFACLHPGYRGWHWISWMALGCDHRTGAQGAYGDSRRRRFAAW